MAKVSEMYVRHHELPNYKISKIWNSLPEYLKNTKYLLETHFTKLLKMYFLDNYNMDCVIPNSHVCDFLVNLCNEPFYYD